MRNGRVLGPIKTTSLKVNVVRVLSNAILSGAIKPGERLNESQLARQLKVSRAPIREALHKMEERGLVVSIPRRGMFVVSLDDKDVQKIAHLRLILEAEALDLCRKNLNSQGRKRLVDLMGKLQRAQSGPPTEIVRRDIEFHRAIWNLTGNEYLVRILSGLIAPLLAYGLLTHEVTTIDKGTLLDRHRTLLEYVQGKSHRSAREVITDHLKPYLSRPSQLQRLSLDKADEQPFAWYDFGFT